MIRFTVTTIAALAIVVAAAIWFSERPGIVSIEWQGWLIEMSVGRFVLSTTVALISALIVIGFFRAVGHVPDRIRESLRISRRERGYRALTQGMVAVASGDPDEANRQARRAGVLLEDPPLTMLLSAQAAQLNGDEEAATRYFKGMLERPETAFLGLRGLLIQSQKNNDRRSELEYAERVYQLQPKTPWVLTTMFDLQIAEGRWRAALQTLEKAIKQRAVPTDATRHRRATVLLGCSAESEAGGDLTQALKFAKQANTLVPGFLPAILRTADLMIRSGKPRRATRIIQEAWERKPHPELARLYGELEKTGSDELKQVKRFEHLLSLNAQHVESHIALAEAALAAELWGEARNHLEKAGGDNPSARICRMMTDLEERSGENPDAVRTWLLRAANAPPAPAWVCDDCGAAWGDWTPVCGNCQALGTLAWGPQSRAPVLGARLLDSGGAETDTVTVLAPEDDALVLENRIPPESPADITPDGNTGPDGGDSKDTSSPA